jgi:predicted RNase H-like HicB family nuclease
MTELTLHVRYTDEGDGWITAEVVEVPGALSQGRTRAEARENAIDALRELLSSYDDETEDADALLVTVGA